MSDPVDVASAVAAIPERKERLRKAFLEIESKKATFTKIGANWKDIDEHFKEVENSLRKSLEEYNAKEKAFEAKVRQAQEALDKRDAEVTAKEQASVARVQEQKDSAVAAILEHKRKRGDGQKASGAKKGQASKSGNGSLAEPDVKVAAGASGNAALDSALSGLLAKETVEKDDVSASKEEAPLKSVCESMNSEALRTLIAKHKKDFNALSAELPPALKCSSDPADLVIKALEGYSPYAGQSRDDWTGVVNRRACVILLEALTEVIADPVKGVDHTVIPLKHKKAAKQLADSWKSKVNLEGVTGFNFSLDAQFFLQILATFGLASDYDSDFLCKLLAIMARRKQTPALCRNLGLESKAPDVVKKLIKESKHIDALSFANSFNLLERFQPVPLLKSYLKEIKKSVQAILKAGSNSSAAQNEARQKEVSALRAVLKTISEYKLESQYPPASIESRIAELEKEKADKKRPGVAPKTLQPKKPRNFIDEPTGSIGKVRAVPMLEKATMHVSDKVDYGRLGGPLFTTVPQPVFDRRPLGSYGAGHGGGNFTSAALPGSYLHPSEGLGSVGFGSSSLLNSSSSYGGYDYRSSLASEPSAYGSYLQ